MVVHGVTVQCILVLREEHPALQAVTLQEHETTQLLRSGPAWRLQGFLV
jgi:hypothetical protein